MFSAIYRQKLIITLKSHEITWGKWVLTTAKKKPSNEGLCLNAVVFQRLVILAALTVVLAASPIVLATDAGKVVSVADLDEVDAVATTLQSVRSTQDAGSQLRSWTFGS